MTMLAVGCGVAAATGKADGVVKAAQAPGKAELLDAMLANGANATGGVVLAGEPCSEPGNCCVAKRAVMKDGMV